jgi:outer membrane protein TolC
MTIEDVTSAAVANSHTLNLRKHQLSQAEAQLDQARASRYGDLDFQAGYTRLSDVPEFFFNFTDILPPAALAQLFTPDILNQIQNTDPQPIVPVILDNYTLQLSASQPLFTGFALSNAQEARELGVKAQKANLERDAESIELQASEAYWSLYKLIQMQKAAQASYDQLQKNLDNVSNLRDAGLATQADYLKLEVARSEAKMAIIEIQNGIMLSTINLNTLMDRPINEPIEPVTTPENTLVIDQQPNFEMAVSNRKDIKASELSVDAAAKSVEISEASYWPSLSLAGNFYYNNPNQRVQPLVDEFNETWDVGIYLQYSISDIWKTDYQVQEAETNRMMAKEQLELQKDMLAVEVSRAYLEVEKQLQKIEATKTTVAQARESRRMTEDQYNNGLAIATDLIDTENALLRAEINYNTAVADLQIAKAKLDYALGR